LDLYPIPDAEKVKMLRKLALFWDGQWFLHSADRFGLEEGIELNADVRAAFGRIEMRTVLKALGKREADDLTDAVRIIATHVDLLLGAGVKAAYEMGENGARIVVRRCAVYAGARMANLPRQDQACIACARAWDAWLRALLPQGKITVHCRQRLGMGDPVCEFVVSEES
jgi:hypothetical protein